MEQVLAMASSLNIKSTYKMNSGYEMPILGYGVSNWSALF